MQERRPPRSPEADRAAASSGGVSLHHAVPKVDGPCCERALVHQLERDPDAEWQRRIAPTDKLRHDKSRHSPTGPAHKACVVAKAVGGRDPQ